MRTGKWLLAAYKIKCRYHQRKPTDKQVAIKTLLIPVCFVPNDEQLKSSQLLGIA
jgi:hypothetical protein